MAKVFFLLITVAGLMLTACAQVTTTPTPGIQTPLAGGQAATGSPPIEATPTPTGEATSTPPAGVQVYPAYGFRFTLPEGLLMAEQPVGGDLRLALGITRSGTVAEGYPRPPIGLRVFEKPEATGLLEWFSGRQETCYDTRGHPWPWRIFIEPHLAGQETFEGNPALHLESGCFPVPSDILIDRGRWVIAVDMLRDYPADYETEYQQLLASLEFFEPEPGQGEAMAAPTATPTVCLDQAARPIPLPPRQEPLEVRFISSGNIWVWVEGEEQARQVTDSGGVENFSFSPDGEQIAYLSGNQTELWAIRRDGSGLRRLVSPEQVQALAGEPPASDAPYTDGIKWSLEWTEGANGVGFEILRNFEGIGGCCESRGYWQASLESGEIEPWSPPERPGDLPGVLSPDGRLQAIADDDSLSIASAEGTILQPDVLTFQPFSANPEGPGTYGATVAWAADSRSLYAIVILEDPFSGPGVDFAVWQVPTDGSPPRQAWTIAAAPFSISVSPNGEYLAYLKAPQPRSNDRELHLAKIDGTEDLVYTQGYALEFLVWAPDGVHFIFDQYSIRAPQWGSVCGGSQALLDPPVMPVSSLTWVDRERFLFVTNGELRLGQVRGGSLAIGPFSGDYASYQFNREQAALGELE